MENRPTPTASRISDPATSSTNLFFVDRIIVRLRAGCHGARPPRRVAPIRRSLSNILFFGKEYALRSWKGNPAHFPFHANAWKRPHPKKRAPEHIGIYCPCTQVSNSDDSLSGVLESRVRFFRLALLPFPFRCRMVGENRAKEIGRFPSFRNISALSVELLRSRGICGTTGTRSERDARSSRESDVRPSRETAPEGPVPAH